MFYEKNDYSHRNSNETEKISIVRGINQKNEKSG
jgi:hypothetical protein